MSDIYVQSGAEFEAVFDMGQAGLVGTLEWKIEDNDGGTVVAATSADVIESPAGSGLYMVNTTAPATLGSYSMIASADGSFAVGTVAVVGLLVIEQSAAALTPPAAPSEGILRGGPCQMWTDVAGVAECCSAEVGSDLDVFEDYAWAATELLYNLSGRQFSGECERTVRPCDPSLGCGVQILSRGHLVYWSYEMGCWCDDSIPACSCSHLSRVVLPNYPVVEITAVLIDGAEVDPAGYRLDRHQYLTRMRDEDGNAQSWPSCQALDLPSDEPGTFEVTYTHGAAPPMAGVLASRELACQMFLACSSASEDVDNCVLPSGATRITRRGVTIDLNVFRGWGYDRRAGWRTGLKLVDAFLNAYNPSGLRRRPLIWSPDGPPFAEEVGTAQGS